MEKILWVMAAGGFGALARWGGTVLVQRLAGGAFPFGTFVVNMAGALLFGLLFGLLESRGALQTEARLYLLTGFMGSFTTFSTYAFEGAALLTSSQWVAAGAYLVGQLVLGVALVLLGLGLGRGL